MKGDAKRLQAMMQQRQAFTDHIFFVGEATEDAPVITVGREKGYAIIGSGQANGGGGGGEVLLQKYESLTMFEQFPSMDFTPPDAFAYLRMEINIWNVTGVVAIVVPSATYGWYSRRTDTLQSNQVNDGVFPLVPAQAGCFYTFKFQKAWTDWYGHGQGWYEPSSPVPSIIGMKGGWPMGPFSVKIPTGGGIGGRVMLYGVT